MMAALSNPETWVAVAFVIFVGLLGYLGVHRQLTKALDSRAERIKSELDEARRLKDEAMALLQEYQRKREAAEGEAQSIVTEARAEADRHGRRGQGKGRGIRRPPHQDGGAEDRPGGGPGRGGCACCCC